MRKRYKRPATESIPSPQKRHRRCPTIGKEEKARGEYESPGQGPRWLCMTRYSIDDEARATEQSERRHYYKYGVRGVRNCGRIENTVETNVEEWYRVTSRIVSHLVALAYPADRASL